MNYLYFAILLNSLEFGRIKRINHYFTPPILLYNLVLINTCKNES